MNVHDAVRSRRSVRDFTDQRVDRAVLERVLESAARTPSGGNIQPWHTYVVTGQSHAAIVEKMSARLTAGDLGDAPQYPIYPADLKSPYRERRVSAGQQLYSVLGIPREDKKARRAWFARNWQFFGAPVGLFCYVDRNMGSAQWSDIGMYLQTIMLLLREEGLASCPQEAWSVYHTTVDEIVQPQADLMLFCGMAIGYEDTAVSGGTIIDRAPMSETVQLLG
ncbi:NADH dehydrogenase [Rhodococcus sp. SC4]|uniref:nitroreductase n=1 Tax=Rhodococcus sp. LB1 TaxID=1807499 RepID=UPI000769DCBF|nr:nitroreductase [Rhodococcus sp. LB1]KXF53851.1 NADH dehydrogenase [Rhodococcus sp. SC4]KXX57395.1 NADH dehydrogenase [Rhodococcus sp. LB1]